VGADIVMESITLTTVSTSVIAFHENAGLCQVKLRRLDVFAVAVAVAVHNIHLPS
jgi:hypothetical protein